MSSVDRPLDYSLFIFNLLIITKNVDNYRFPCLAVVGIYEEIDIQLLEVVSKVQVNCHFSLLVASGNNVKHNGLT